MKVKMTKSAYEAPRTDIVLMETNACVFMASPAPAAGITGSGFHFESDNGSW